MENYVKNENNYIMIFSIKNDLQKIRNEIEKTE